MFRNDLDIKPVTLAEMILYTYNKVIGEINEKKFIVAVKTKDSLTFKNHCK